MKDKQSSLASFIRFMQVVFVEYSKEMMKSTENYF